MITKYQENELENVQKRRLRCLYGYRKTYEELLTESVLKTLKDRRTAAIEKFARKTADNLVYKRSFQENNNPRAG